MTNTSGILSTSGSQIYIAGQASGLNTTALVDAAVAAKTAKADQIDVQVSENDDKFNAYDKLQTLAQGVQDALAKLSTPTTYSATDTSVFSLKAAYLTSSDGSDPTAYMTAVVDNTASAGSYDIEVQQKAEAMKAAGTVTVADNTAALGYTGSFNVGLAGGTSAQIDITSGMSMNDLAAAINSQTGTTGVKASVLKVGENAYSLVMEGTQTAKDIQTSVVSGDDVLNLVGMTDGTGNFQNVVQAAQQAQIKVDGVTVTRDDNKFDDLFTGVEVDILAAKPGTTFTLDVGNDNSAVKDAITGFVDAYNAFRDFVVSADKVNADGSTDSPLFSDFMMDSMNKSVIDLMTSDYSANSSVIQTLSDVGITLDKNNKLEISNETKLDTAIVNNFNEVKNFFASSYTSDNSNLALLRNNSSAATLNFTLNVTTDGSGNITGVDASGDNTAFTIDGTRIVGATGTPYEGLVFSYVGTTSASINIDLAQGLSDRVSNAINPYSDVVTGLIQQQKVSLQETNKTLSARATDIRQNAQDYREQLVNKYAAMEAKIQQLSLLKNQISAIFGLNNNNNKN